MTMEGVVLFEYEKQEDDELSLKVGDVVLDVKQADEGWCEGTLGGIRGMFPDNFVKLRPAQGVGGGGGGAAPDTAKSRDQVPPLRGMDSTAKTRRAKVTFSYAAENDDELSLEPGQVVKEVSEEEDGWWKGTVGGKTGVFPSNFVEVIPEEPAVENSRPPRPPSPDTTAEPARPSEQPEGRHASVVQPRPPPGGGVGLGLGPGFNPVAAMANLKKTPKAQPPPVKEVKSQPPLHATQAKQDIKPHPPAPPPSSAHAPTKAPPPVERERAKVTFEYDAQNTDELTIKVGDIVEIVAKDLPDQDGWWEVKLGEQTGLIPDNFVELLPPAPAPSPQHQPPAAAKTKTTPPVTEDTPTPMKEPPHKPAAPPAVVKKPGSIYNKKRPVAPPPAGRDTPTSVTPEPHDEPDFGVPTTTPLDNSAVKSRPKKVARPPSRSNLHFGDENGVEDSPEVPPPSSSSSTSSAALAPPTSGGGGGGGEVKLSPWQAELKQRKHKPPPPKPSVKPPPTKPHPPGSTVPVKPADKPHPPPAKPLPHALDKPHPPVPAAKEPEKKAPPPVAMQPTKPAHPVASKPEIKAAPEISPDHSTIAPSQSSTATAVTVATTSTGPPAAVQSEIAALKDSLKKFQESSSKELKELRDEMRKFKADVRTEIDTLTDDLDRERKYRATLEVDIDRLRKKLRENVKL